MSEFETNLRWLSERGKPVGPEELIERIEGDMAGDPLVVVAKRREGTIMTKTQQRPTNRQSSRYRGPAWGVAAFAAILAVAGLYLAFADDSGEVADNPPPPTTVAPDVETSTDLEIIEAGVAALYSGDADRAAELFELGDLTDDDIRQMSAYEKAIGGRLTVDCTERQTPGEFTCRVPYHNTLTDAIGFSDGGDTNPVVVNDGVITTFGFPEHTGMLVSVAAYLALELGSEVPEECFVLGPFPETCATIHIENLDGWATFYKTEWPGLEPGLMSELEGVFETEACDGPPSECRAAMYQFFSSWVADHSVTSDLEVIEAGVAAVYSGDADRAAELFELEASPSDDDLPLTDEQVRAVAVYQKAIGGRLTLDCTELQTSGEFSCRVPYHNALTDAIGFTDGGDTNRVVVKDGVITTFGFPEHSEMLVSMTSYLARELGGEVPEECRHWYSPFTENCVAIQFENLDGWAAFYKEEWPEHGDLIDQIVSIFESDVCQQGTIEECDRAHYRAITDWAADQE